MTRYVYRPIIDPSELRPNERLVTLTIDTGYWATQGNRTLASRFQTRLFAEYAVLFHSRIHRIRS